MSTRDKREQLTWRPVLTMTWQLPAVDSLLSAALLPYLQACTHSTRYGFYRIDPGYVCVDFRGLVTADQVRDELRRLDAADVIMWDDETNALLIPFWFDLRKLDGPNDIIGAVRFYLSRACPEASPRLNVAFLGMIETAADTLANTDAKMDALRELHGQLDQAKRELERLAKVNPVTDPVTDGVADKLQLVANKRAGDGVTDPVTDGVTDGVASERNGTELNGAERSLPRAMRSKAASHGPAVSPVKTKKDASKRAAKSAPTTPERDRNAWLKSYAKLIEEMTTVRDKQAKGKSKPPTRWKWKGVENLPIDARKESIQIKEVCKSLNRNFIPPGELQQRLEIHEITMTTVPLIVDAWLALTIGIPDWTVDGVGGELREMYDALADTHAAAARG